jgi:hypothetical protein
LSEIENYDQKNSKFCWGGVGGTFVGGSTFVGGEKGAGICSSCMRRHKSEDPPSILFLLLLKPSLMLQINSSPEGLHISPSAEFIINRVNHQSPRT